MHFDPFNCKVFCQEIVRHNNFYFYDEWIYANDRCIFNF